MGKARNGTEIAISAKQESPYLLVISRAELAAWEVQEERYKLRIRSGNDSSQCFLRVYMQVQELQLGLPVYSYLKGYEKDIYKVRLVGGIGLEGFRIGLFLYYGTTEMKIWACGNWSSCIQTVNPIFTLTPARDGVESGSIMQLYTHYQGRECFLLVEIENPGADIAVSTVICSSPHVQIVLRDSEALEYYINSAETMWAKYTVLGNQAEKVTFQLIEIGGNAQIQVNQGCGSVSRTGKEVVEYDGKEGVNGTYCIAISAANGPAAFSLLAYTDKPVAISTLRPGRLQTIIPRNTSVSSDYFYCFTATAGSELILIPQHSRYSVSINSSPALYVSQYTVNNTVQIETESLFYATIRPLDFISAAFHILLRTRGTPVALLENVALVDWVSEHDRTYVLDLVGTLDVIITLTAYTGDPDLYISVGRDHANSGSAASHFAYESIGSSTAYLRWAQDLYLLCNRTSPCPIYLLISAFSPSFYQIQVSRPESNKTSHLGIGKMQAGRGSQAYFSYVDPSKSLDYSLQTISGTCKLHMSSDTKVPMSWSLPEGNNDDNRPNSGLQQVSIPQERLNKACNGSICTAVIAVICSNFDAQYYLYALQDILLLAEGFPYRFRSQFHHFTYFLLYNMNENALIQLHARALYGQGAVWYISRGVESRPNENNHEWSFAEGAEIAITGSDPLFNSSSMSGYYVATLKTVETCTYEVVYQSSSLRPTYIVPETANKGYIAANSITYYAYQVLNFTDLTINLTPLIGSFALYVLTSLSETTLPSLQDYYWKSPHSHLPYELLIAREDPYFCLNCSLIVAVESERAGTFILQVVDVYDAIVILNGVPVIGSLDQGLSRLYLYEIYALGTVDVAATPYTGAISLYISYSPDINATDCLWSSLSTPPHLIISSTDPQFRLGTAYILVTAGETSNYALTVHIRGSHIQLVDGWAQIYSIENTREDSLSFDYQVHESIAQCHLRPLRREFKPKVTPSFQPDSSYANFSTQQLHTREAFGEMLINYEGETAGKLNIEVSGQGNNWFQASLFSLVCISKAASARLQPGIKVFGLLTSLWQEAKYSLQIEHPGRLTVDLETCGDPLNLQVRNSSSHTMTGVTEQIGARIVLNTLANGPQFYDIEVSSTKHDYTPFRLLATLSSLPANTGLNGTITAGNNGTILWSQLSAHRVEFHWSAPYLSPSVSNRTVVYRAFYTYEEREKLGSACGIGLGELIGVVKQADIPLLIAQTTFRYYINTSNPVHFTVIAYIGELEVLYSPITIQLLAASTYIYWIYAAIACVVVCLAVIVRKLVGKWRRIRLRKVTNANQSVLEQSVKVKSQYGELGEE